ncbi:dynein regulatory complex protein 10-like [Haliotis rufescens]|uniref:dynein regulatory complex protein 10-like n=1 Tax=Haliotis rufescens TaxID=6454 RepID=UPI001EB04290|nr:dynein regulatory complex protein 10-like [Haliotis rufescens]
MAAAMTVTDVVTVTQPQVEPTLQIRLQAQTLPRPPPTMAPQARFRKGLKIDPSRALEPTRKKLSTIEAQRVMTVFEETIRRVEVITLLPHILQNLDRFRISFGQELIELLEQHYRIQGSYQEIRDILDQQLAKRLRSGKSRSTQAVEEEGQDELDREETQGESMVRPSSASSAGSFASIDSQTENMRRSLTYVAHQLSSSCKNILRCFSINPTAMNAVSAEFKKRDIDCKALCRNLHELKEILLGKLLTTPGEEKERMAYLDEISQRERNNAIVIEKMETELKAASDDKDEEIRKKNDVIRRLQADLHQIEKFSEEHIRRVKTEAEKQEAADVKNSEGKRQKLQQEINQLRTQLQNLTMEHRESEQELRKRKFKIETEVENWIQKYDQDMGERQDEYEEIDAIYTEEKKQLNELEERFKTLEAEYLQIMEERRLAREKREKAERELALMVKAATTVQAFWRSFKVRKALKSKKKKKGGGGKKKKK